MRQAIVNAKTSRVALQRLILGPRHTGDQRVAYRAALHLAHFSIHELHFFLALGLSSMHAWPTASPGGGTQSCKMEAIVEENGRSVPQNYELPPLRNESERDPPFFSNKTLTYR